MKRSFLAGLCSAFLIFTMLQSTKVEAQTYEVAKGKNAAFAKVTDDPALPRVLIIGDSISIGYTPPLRELMKGVANIHRIPVNGGPTSRGVENIDAWLEGGPWDVIHFNWGLHDLVYMTESGKRNDPPSGVHQVPIDQYEKNLRLLVKKLLDTKAKLIWRNTTPVPKGSKYRLEGEEGPYNEVAAKIMKEYNIPIDDHHSVVMQRMSELQLPANVHFTSNGSKELAKLAAKAIKEQLPE